MENSEDSNSFLIPEVNLSDLDSDETDEDEKKIRTELFPPLRCQNDANDDDEDGEEEKGERTVEIKSNSNSDIRILMSQDGKINWLNKPVKVDDEKVDKQVDMIEEIHVVLIKDIKEAFNLYFNDELKNELLTYVNSKGKNVAKAKWRTVSLAELEATVGLCILTGIFMFPGQPTRELWEDNFGISIFRATMSFNRFHEILSYLRFDDCSSFGCKYLQMFNNACRNNYMCKDEIAIGEIKYSSRSSWDKSSGITQTDESSFWVAVNVSDSYCISYEPNNGETDAASLINSLCSHLYDQNRLITTVNNLFVEYDLAIKLLKSGTYLLGPVLNTSTEIPNEMLDHTRKVGTACFGFTDQLMIYSFVQKRNTNSFLMSSYHTSNYLTVHQDYNRAVVSIHNLNTAVQKYSVRNRTKHLRNSLFYNTFDIACYNAFLIWKISNPDWNSTKHVNQRSFLKQLAMKLTEPQVNLRSGVPTLSRSTKMLMQNAQGTTFGDSQPAVKRKRCYICPSYRDRKTKVICQECKLNVCGEHQVSTVFCLKCLPH